ncbi:uncharacterized protein LOC131958554 isoform X2 [Physella acuta]|uniref:uncharacterized protein LOC131958554 isoform X2 n=1 Tax=Physella acuta TaxID=109671 RepID=UPI0027DBDC21|nr:uncharacterized protein LOC131958554 isoform X2 [Physella acuta]
MMRSCIATLAFCFIISSTSYNPDAFPAPELIDEESQASSDESGVDNQAPQVLGDPSNAFGHESGDKDKPLIVSDPLEDDIVEAPAVIKGGETSSENFVPQVISDPVGSGDDVAREDPAEPVGVGDPVFVVEEGSGDVNGENPTGDGNDVPFEVVESGDDSNESSKGESSDEDYVPEIAVDPPFSVGGGSGDYDAEIPVIFEVPVQSPGKEIPDPVEQK